MKLLLASDCFLPCPHSEQIPAAALFFKACVCMCVCLFKMRGVLVCIHDVGSEKEKHEIGEMMNNTKPRSILNEPWS